MHVVEQFGMGVHVPPPGGDFGVKVGNAIDDRHWKRPRLIAVIRQPRVNLANRHKKAREAGKSGRYSVFEPSGERVAQLVEHVTFNHGVVGSNPAGLTN